MLLEITTTHRPATDLGYLLAKNPATARSFDLTFGQAHVYYPEVGDERCTCALLLDVDPVELVRGRSGAIDQYVNDRPFVASSFLSVAISEVFGTALGGRSRERAELAATPIPLEARLAAVPCRGGEALLRALFEPLGYGVEAVAHPLDETQPMWGASPYLDVALRGVRRLGDLLSHLYVLVPVLDDDKHYFVSAPEVEKLLRHGEGWLANHPERERITRRYLRHQRSLTRSALARLAGAEEADPEESATRRAAGEAALERPIRLDEARREAVLAALRDARPKSVVDLGCGEGRLLRELVRDRTIERVGGVDVSARALDVAARRLRLDQMSPSARARVELHQSSLVYRDRRLEGFEAAACVEVIEHLDATRLVAFEQIVLGCLRPRVLVVTTPNREWNVLMAGLPDGKLRHADHRFEWTRAEFLGWCERVASRWGCRFDVRAIGPQDPSLGAPTQMAVFRTTTAPSGVQRG